MPLKLRIHNLLIEKKWTLACAESCSGGLLAYQFVQMPDCSNYFCGSLIAYTNQAKKDLLGVSDDSLTQFGAVSQQVAREMAIGALQKFDTYIALSVTGLAGPAGGSDVKPVGTVFIGLARVQKSALVWGFEFAGNRQTIIKKSVNAALRCLWDEIQL